MRYLRHSIMPLLMVLVSACALHSPAPEDQYVLKANIAPANACHLKMNVRINEPEVAPGLDTARIALLDSPHHINYYTGAIWAAPAPQMIQKFLVTAFEQSQRFKSISMDSDGVNSALTIVAMIQDYEVLPGSMPSVHILFNVKIIGGNREVRSNFVAEKMIVAEKNHMPAIIDAFNSGMNEIAQNIIDQTSILSGKCNLK
jgi:ABC-type uncharacterized transport system auxiliary subunit